MFSGFKSRYTMSWLWMYFKPSAIWMKTSETRCGTLQLASLAYERVPLLSQHLWNPMDFNGFQWL